MTPDEAKARRDAQDAALAGLEATIARLAAAHAVPVMLAIMRALVEMVCASQGDVFRVSNKIRFYRGVVAMLRTKGIE